MNELRFMNACGLLTFGIEPDGLPDFPLLHEMLEGLEAFLSRGVTSLGRHHGLHVTDGTGDKLVLTYNRDPVRSPSRIRQ